MTAKAGGETDTWTSANDNGNGGSTPDNTALSATELQIALDAPLSSLLQG